MDPDIVLRRTRELVASILVAYEDEGSNGINQDDAADLAEYVNSLDEWLSKGGFKPKDWQK